MPCPKKKKLQFKARIKNKFDQLLTSVARFKPGKLTLYSGTTSAQNTAPTFLPHISHSYPVVGLQSRQVLTLGFEK